MNIPIRVMKIDHLPLEAKTSSEFLQRAFARQKNRRRGFGLKRLSEEMGFKSPSMASMILNGKRRLRLDSLDSAATSLGLPEKEKRVLSALIRLGSTKSKTEEFQLKEKILELKGASRGKALDIRQYRFLSEWYYPALFMMIAESSFREDPQWIVRKLGKGITVAQVKRAIEDLLSIGVVKRESGKLVQTEKTFKTPDDLKAIAIQAYHRKMLELAIQSLELPLPEREMNSLTVLIPKDRLPEMKEKIREFRKEINRALEDVSSDAEVYQMNIQLFPLTQSVAESSEKEQREGRKGD